MLLSAQRNVNRGLDNDVHKLMAQLEDLNRRYAALGRRTAGLQVTSVSANAKGLRMRCWESHSCGGRVKHSGLCYIVNLPYEWHLGAAG